MAARGHLVRLERHGLIKAQLFDATGTRIGGEFSVNTEAGGNQSEPTITSLAGGGFVVSWTDASLIGEDTSLTSIKAQMFDATGAKLDAEFLVNTQMLNGQLSPTITGLADSGFVVSWTDYSFTGRDASGTSIKAQIFRITDINTDPIAADDHIAGTAEDTLLTIPAAMLLANETDAEAADVLTVLSVRNGVGGTPLLNPDSSITFVPATLRSSGALQGHRRDSEL